MIEKWIPTPNIRRITPISANSAGRVGVGDDPGRERADRDAGEQVTDDRRQPEAIGDDAADEAGAEADRDRLDQGNGMLHA